MRAEPRVRVSAVLRWHEQLLLCRHEKRGREAWLLPGGGVHSGESLIDALEREIARGGGDRRRRRSKGRWRSSTRSRPNGLVSKHVVHIIFAGDLDGSLEAVVSQDEAVRGHRLFRSDELDGIVLHPPIQRFLARWRPGDPAVYLGALWTP